MLLNRQQVSKANLHSVNLNGEDVRKSCFLWTYKNKKFFKDFS